MGLEVIVVVFLQEGLDLLGDELEELFVGTGHHQVAGDGDFRLSQREGAVAMELDGTDPEVGSTQINCQIQSLFRVRRRSNQEGMQSDLN